MLHQAGKLYVTLRVATLAAKTSKAGKKSWLTGKILDAGRRKSLAGSSTV